ncbi:hypothetical protein [Microbacterium sp.]|uniref:hypothetical protein n=1 Tax=Microbacterium sp. TaxID=51671 RepID=UPI00322140B4
MSTEATTERTELPLAESAGCCSTTASGDSASSCCGAEASAAPAAASCCSTEASAEPAAASCHAEAPATESHGHDHGHGSHGHGDHGDHGHGHDGHGHGHGDHGHGDHGHHHAAPTASASGDDVAMCPVMVGSPVVKSVAEAQGLFRDYKGKRYWFCCAACGPLWDADPDKYADAA